MIRIINDKLVIEMDHVADGELVVNIQKSLIAGIQAIAESDLPRTKYDCETYYLTEILKATLLSDSETNVALGAKPY
jgi:hypothetical protein